MELECRDISPPPILPPTKTKRRRKTQTRKRAHCRSCRQRDRAGHRFARRWRYQRADVVVIAMVAVVVFVIGAAIFKPDAVKTATEFFGAIGKVWSTLVT